MARRMTYWDDVDGEIIDEPILSWDEINWEAELAADER
jgi:hypothetical protein